MANCKHCGSEFAEGAKFCPACGKAVEASGGPEQGYDKFVDAAKRFVDTEDSTSAFSSEDIAAGRVMSYLSYIGILVLIPFFVEKKSRFALFHVEQGMNLLLLEIAHFLIFTVIGRILSLVLFFFPIFDILWGLLSAAAALVLVAFIAAGFYNVYKGKARPLPVIGRIRIFKKTY